MDEEKSSNTAQQTATSNVRPDLAEVIRRHAFTLDENRPDAVAKRKAKNQRTARANVMDLCDEGSFIEYGALAIAAQRGRRKIEELMVKTPTDGMIAGMGTVNGSLFGPEKSRCMVLAYDYYGFSLARRGSSITKRRIACYTSPMRSVSPWYFLPKGAEDALGMSMPKGS